jgi:hypothetical protein
MEEHEEKYVLVKQLNREILLLRSRPPSLYTDQREQDKEPRDVADHSTERYLKWTENFKGRHQVRRSGDAHNIGDSKQYVGYYLGIVGLPFEPS